MDHGACNVIYLDRRAEDESVRRSTLANSRVGSVSSNDGHSVDYFKPTKTNPAAEVRENIEIILTFFNEVHICRSGSSCLSKISQLLRQDTNNTPILVLIDVPYDEERLRRLSREPRAPSPTANRKHVPEVVEPEDIYGTHLLLHLSSEVQQKTYPKLVVPVVVLSGFDTEWSGKGFRSPALGGPSVLTDTVRLVKYLDAGAVDVYTSPLSRTHVNSLAVHAYRVYRDVSKDEPSFLTTKRNRKLSWVGVEEQKPYAYLREAMVSGLMGKICNPETVVETYDPTDLEIEASRKAAVAGAIGTWEFSAHDFSDDELLYGALLMLQHALQMPELKRWRLSEEELLVFLLASRSAYNEFVLYHNFRHVTDVLQALFFSLLQIGILPPYPNNSGVPATTPCVVATLLKPFDALTLLISAIGHDVGHPGVNNAFLVALNSPLAQLYNDRSVLESFHCAAYSQILRRFWPEAFSDIIMRKLMINSILATDMGLHFKYMADLGNFQEKLADNKNTLDGWSAKSCDEYKDLLCGLLIKCADISNVARKFETASRWASILTDEFSNQGNMEQELQMPTCLFGGPPILDDVIKMGESQIGFMNIFARPLFEAVSDVLPNMRFSVEEILKNKAIWEKKIETEKAKNRLRDNSGFLDAITPTEVIPSPRSRSKERLPGTRDANQTAVAPGLTQQRNQKTTTPPGASMTGSSRPSSGSGPFQFTGAASSRRSSQEGGSALSQSTDVPSPRQVHAETMDQARPGSADPNLTAIIVTQNSGNVDGQDKKPRDSSFQQSEDPMPRPTTAPSPQKGRFSPSAADLAGYPTMTPPRPLQPDFDSQTRLSGFHHVASEPDLAHLANGTTDGSNGSRFPRSWNHEVRKRSNDSGVSPQAENVIDPGRLRPGNSKGSQRWTSGTWRRDRSAGDLSQEKSSNRDDKGGYLSNVTSNTSTPSHPERSRSGKFGLSKFWKKLKPNGEPRGESEAESKSPRAAV